MAADPNFAATPGTEVAQVTAANTARDGTGTVVTVLTAPASGTMVLRVVVKATGTTTAGMIRLFLYNGTNTRLYDEIPVLAITPTATVETFQAEVEYEDCILPNGWELRATTHNAETFNVIAFAGDFT
jgi:hypothetical protein